MQPLKNSIIVGILIISSIVFITLYLLVRYPPLTNSIPKERVLPPSILTKPTVYPKDNAFAHAQQPVLKRQSDRSTEYEIVGRFVSVPTLNKDGEYTGQFTVTVGETEVVLPVTLGRDTFTIFLGEHSGNTPGSASKYSMKTVAEAMPFLTLKAGTLAVLRLKTKIDVDIDPQNAQCGEYCQYLWKWLGESGADVENILDALIRAEQRSGLSKTMLFVQQVGFLSGE